MIARVFPRRTSATPDDEYAFVGEPPFFEFLPPDITEIHISVTFSWDIPFARHLEQTWRRIAPVKLGGPALGSPAFEFQPGMYLKQGYLFTSRGCPNSCWFCDVPRREGALRELEVKEGWNILDSNLLACSEQHIRKVFDMLSLRKEKVLLTGGLEAERLREWHVELFEAVKVQEAFFAYDLPDDLPALRQASKLLTKSTWYRDRKVRCYVLCGYPGDTPEAAEKRCIEVLELGYFPFAMFYRNSKGQSNKSHEWAAMQQKWTRPAAISSIKKTLNSERYSCNLTYLPLGI